MEVSEIFQTWQGEGPRTGYCSIFLRLRRCNLACIWCDTRYTWDARLPEFQEYADMTPREVWWAVRGAMQEPFDVPRPLWAIGSDVPGNLVITGGEPMIWRRAIEEMLGYIPTPWTFEIETNGTIPPLDTDRNVRYNVSPKLITAYNGKRQTIRPYILEQYAALDSVFKFVVTDRVKDWGELRDLVSLLRSWGVDTRNRILLMAVGTEPEVLKANQAFVYDLAQRLAVGVTFRQHILEWGNERRR